MDKKGKELPASNRLSGSGRMAPAADSRSEGRDLNYFHEARLFLGKERATLTFYVNQEVASIHYDTHRDEIFYRGHNVKNMTMSQEQWQSLQKFAEYLEQAPHAGALLRSYKRCLEHLMAHHGSSST